MKSDFDKEADAAAWCLEILTRGRKNYASAEMEISPEDKHEKEIDQMHEDKEDFLEVNFSDQVGFFGNTSI